MLKKKIKCGKLDILSETKCAMVKLLLSSMKKCMSKDQVLQLLQYNESLFRYALRKKLIKAHHLYSSYFYYTKNFRNVKR